MGMHVNQILARASELANENLVELYIVEYKYSARNIMEGWLKKYIDYARQ